MHVRIICFQVTSHLFINVIIIISPHVHSVAGQVRIFCAILDSWYNWDWKEQLAFKFFDAKQYKYCTIL